MIKAYLSIANKHTVQKHTQHKTTHQTRQYTQELSHKVVLKQSYIGHLFQCKVHKNSNDHYPI